MLFGLRGFTPQTTATPPALNSAKVVLGFLELALALAGGLNSFAKRGQIKVFRKNDGKTKIFEFDYDDVTEGKKLEQNIQLVRGDVVVVP